MKRPANLEVGVFLGLATAGIALRLAFQEIPNFAPVAALALFAGYYFSSRWTALALPLLVMGVTDTFIGGYHPGMMAVVYAALAAPVLCSGLLRRRLSLTNARKDGAWRQASASTAGLVTCSLGASVFFFLTTNFAHWAIYDMYEKSAAGLLQCAAAALPFFRYTLAGDLAFACVLFGGYALAVNLAGEKAHAIE